MRIALLCATRRGLASLRKLAELAPDCEWLVFSFREEAGEPPFLDDIRDQTLALGGQFVKARQVGQARLDSLWESTPVDLMLLVSWRYMLPPRVYERARLGAYVFHDALLPKYRGFAPTVWAILNGEATTGATLFRICETVDAGDIVDQRPVSIGPDDTVAEVMERVTQAYLDLLAGNLKNLLAGQANAQPQDHSQATYTCKRLPEDNLIDWSRPTQHIYNLIRASTAPYPGAYTWLKGERLRIWAARRVPDGQPYVGRVPGRVVESRPGEGATVLTGDGALRLSLVQLDNQPAVSADAVLKAPSTTLGR